MLQLGKSTLVLNEEMLQMLDAVDLVKSGPQSTCRAVANIPAQPERNSFAHLGRAPNPSGQEKLTAEKEQGGGGRRPGYSTGCKDLVQRLLFSEDTEEAQTAQAHSETSASTKKESCQETSNTLNVGPSSK